MPLVNSVSYRNDWQGWLRAFEFNVGFTVSPNDSLRSWWREQEVMKAIDANVNRYFIGPRYSKKSEAERLAVVIVPEYKLTQTHFHGALRVSGCRCLTEAIAVIETRLTRLFKETRDGRRFLPKTSLKITLCDEGWVKYILKWLERDTLVYVRGLLENTTCARRGDVRGGCSAPSAPSLDLQRWPLPGKSHTSATGTDTHGTNHAGKSRPQIVDYKSLSTTNVLGQAS